MPNLPSAKKRQRQSERRAQRNKTRRTKMKSLIKKASDDPTEENVRVACQAIDKAAKAGIIQDNKAARLKSKTMKSS